MNKALLKTLILVTLILSLYPNFITNIFATTQEKQSTCEPLIAKNGYYFLKAKGSGVELKLPYFTDIRRSSSVGCDIAKTIFVDYLWFNGNLVPQSEYSNKVPKGEYMPVRLYYKNSWSKKGDAFI